MSQNLENERKKLAVRSEILRLRVTANEQRDKLQSKRDELKKLRGAK